MFARSQVRTQVMARVFIDHPQKVGESYFRHMKFALGFAFWLCVAAGAVLLHALVPALCEMTAGRIVVRLSERLATRH